MLPFRSLHQSLAPRRLEAALRDLGHATARVRASAARDLARHAGGSERARVLERLVATLADDDAAVREAATLALADAAAIEALPDLLGACDDPATGVRQMAIAALGEIAPEAPSSESATALPALKRALDDPEAPVRFQAVMAFARASSDHDEVVAALLGASRDDDPLVCHIALRMAEELGSIREDEAIDPRLVQRALALLDHDDDAVRAVAAIVVTRAGRSEGSDILAAAVRRELRTAGPDDEAAAVELCGEKRIDSAREALNQRAWSGILNHDPFAWHARVALAAMGDERACRWVVGELGAWSRERRSLAVAAAGKARLRQARPALEAMRGKPDRADAQAVEEALRAIDTGDT